MTQEPTVATVATRSPNGCDMAVPARDLRNHYGALLGRAEAGESIDIERDGRVVATLGPPRVPVGTPAGRVLEVFKHSEPVDYDQFMEDLYGPDGLDDGFGARWGDADSKDA